MIASAALSARSTQQMVQSIRRKRGQAIVINGITVEIKCIYPGHVILHVSGGGAVRKEGVKSGLGPNQPLLEPVSPQVADMKDARTGTETGTANHE